MHTMLSPLQFQQILLVKVGDHIGKNNCLASLLQKHDLVASVLKAGQDLGWPVRVYIEFGKYNTAHLELVLDEHFINEDK